MLLSDWNQYLPLPSFRLFSMWSNKEINSCLFTSPWSGFLLLAIRQKHLWSIHFPLSLLSFTTFTMRVTEVSHHCRWECIWCFSKRRKDWSSLETPNPSCNQNLPGNLIIMITTTTMPGPHPRQINWVVRFHAFCKQHLLATSHYLDVWRVQVVPISHSPSPTSLTWCSTLCFCCTVASSLVAG